MPPPTQPRRRADAERSVARILEAAVEALARDPDASMEAIARRAGVVRATIYVHFPTREALIDAVTRHAVGEVTELIQAAEPARGEPAEALARVVSEAWRALGRFHALVAINARLPPDELRDRHAAVLAALEPLAERGRRDGSFRADQPTGWHLSMILALVHAASAEQHGGRIAADAVEPAVVATVLGALGAGGRAPD